MGVMDTLAELTARALSINLSPAQRERGVGLFVAKSVKADADARDLMILANYVVTGTDVIPEPRDEPYPYSSGDVLVLGPQIFANRHVPDPEAVINWQGVNFVPQTNPWARPVVSEEPEHPDDPGPAAPTDGAPIEDEPEPSGDLPSFDPLTEPAPMAGAHWRGRRGGQPG